MYIAENEIWKLLETVFDPEIPVLNIVEMGIVREVNLNNNACEIKITPTYSGCPAMNTIENEIIKVLSKAGIKSVKVEKIFTETWTTDWIGQDARNKLRKYGIAPPEGESASDFYDNILTKNITCPYCKSTNTELTSEFGSTSCKSLHFCKDCHQPFEHFKCI